MGIVISVVHCSCSLKSHRVALNFITAVFNWGDMSPLGDGSDFGGDMTPSAVMEKFKAFLPSNGVARQEI